MKKFVLVFVAMFSVVGMVFSQSKNYKVGDIGPGGGIVFYVDSNGFVVNNNICHYFEVYPEAIGEAVFGKDGSIQSKTASQLCNDFKSGDTKKGDWFLPSLEQLKFVRHMLEPIIALRNGGSTGGLMSFWTSSERNSEQAYSVAFCFYSSRSDNVHIENGATYGNKMDESLVLAVHAF